MQRCWIIKTLARGSTVRNIPLNSMDGVKETGWRQQHSTHAPRTNLLPFCMCENYRKCVYSSGHQALSSRLQTPHPALRHHTPCACAVKRSRSTPASLQCRRVGQKTWNRNLIQRPATYRAVLATNTHEHTHTHTHGRDDLSASLY